MYSVFRHVIAEGQNQDRHPLAFRRFVYMPEYDLWAEKVCQIYVARPARRIGPPTEAGHTEIWAPLEAAVELVANVGDRAFLERYL